MSPADWHDNPRSADAALVANVLKAIPELADSYKDHLDDNGELLPYVYLPDAVRALEVQLQEGKLTVDSCAKLAEVMEQALSEGGSVQNLALIGLTDEIAYSHITSRRNAQRSLLDLMRNVLGERTKRAISETLAPSP